MEYRSEFSAVGVRLRLISAQAESQFKPSRNMLSISGKASGYQVDQHEAVRCVTPLHYHFLGPSLAVFPRPVMSDPSPSSRLQVLFESALKDYEKQTGTKLTEHPLAQQLETCDSIGSITAVIQGQARDLGEFKRNEGKVSKSLHRAVSVLYPLSAGSVLGDAISVVGLVVLVSNAAFLMFVFFL